MGFYEDLMAVVAPSEYDDQSDTDSANAALAAIDACTTQATDIITSLSPSISGSLHDAVHSWINEYVRRMNEHRDNLTTARSHYATARAAMLTAAMRAKNLPTDASLDNLHSTLSEIPQVDVDYTCMTGEAYANALIPQYKVERDNKSQEYLKAMNDAMVTEKENLLIKEDEGDSPPGSDLDTGYGATYSGGGVHVPGNGIGGSGAKGVGVVPDVTGTVGTPSSMSTLGGAVLSNHDPVIRDMHEWERPAPGEPGSRSNPITDPEQLRDMDLLHTPINQRMTSDGPVGGYLPPPVDNALDPAWRTGFPGSALSSHTDVSNLTMAGGVIGTGAAAALARSGMSGLAGLSAAGVGALSSQVPGGGILSPASTAPAQGVAGMAPTAMSGTSAGSSDSKSASSHNAKSQSGGAKDKNRRKRRSKEGHHALLLRPENSNFGITSGQGAGSFEDLRPIDSREDDQW